MAATAKFVNKFGDVRLTLQGARVAAQDKLAEKAVEYAIADAPKDTGFYSEHIFALTSANAGGPSISQRRIDRKGRNVLREANEYIGAQIASSAIVAQAKYAIYVELRYFTIYKASMRAGAEFPSIVSEVRQTFKLGG